MDYSTAKGKDGSGREGWGTAVHSVFWKRLLNAQEGSRDLSILLLGEKHRDLYTPLHRIVILPTFPGVLSTPGTPAHTHPNCINACQALTGGRGQRVHTSLCLRNKLQTTLCSLQVQGHHQGPQEMVLRRCEPGQSKMAAPQTPNHNPHQLPSGSLHAHIHRPSRQMPRFCSLSQICLINLNLKRNT